MSGVSLVFAFVENLATERSKQFDVNKKEIRISKHPSITVLNVTADTIEPIYSFNEITRLP